MMHDWGKLRKIGSLAISSSTDGVLSKRPPGTALTWERYASDPRRESIAKFAVAPTLT
jgi:hypothetical protein